MAMRRKDWDSVFMDMCEILKDRSMCLKYQTATIIVKNSQIIAIGYNGTASKKAECADHWLNYWAELFDETPFEKWIQSEEFREMHSKWSEIYEIHAEVNALNWISKSVIDDTCVLYTFYSPCERCAKHIISYGVKRVCYRNNYTGRSKCGSTGLKILRENDVVCEQITR